MKRDMSVRVILGDDPIVRISIKDGPCLVGKLLNPYDDSASKEDIFLSDELETRFWEEWKRVVLHSTALPNGELASTVQHSDGFCIALGEQPNG